MRRVFFILGQLSDSDVEWLSTVGVRRKVAAGTELISEGSNFDTVYFILDGQLSVWVGSFKLANVTSGDILGEMSLVDSRKASASVKCDTEAVLLAISKEKLSDRLKIDIGFAARFYKAIAVFLADRMRHAIKRMGYGKFEDEVAQDEIDFDELDVEVLDKVHLAGARFERILKRFSGQ